MFFAPGKLIILGGTKPFADLCHIMEAYLVERICELVNTTINIIAHNGGLSGIRLTRNQSIGELDYCQLGRYDLIIHTKLVPNYLDSAMVVNLDPFIVIRLEGHFQQCCETWDSIITPYDPDHAVNCGIVNRPRPGGPRADVFIIYNTIHNRQIQLTARQIHNLCLHRAFEAITPDSLYYVLKDTYYTLPDLPVVDKWVFYMKESSYDRSSEIEAKIKGYTSGVDCVYEYRDLFVYVTDFICGGRRYPRRVLHVFYRSGFKIPDQDLIIDDIPIRISKPSMYMRFYRTEVIDA